MDDAVPADIALTGEQGFIDAETFDFNLSVSPESHKESNKTQEEEVFAVSHEHADMDDDDDEVYLGPVSFKEQCVATRVELVEQKDPAHMAANLLTAEQYVELFKEANSIALELGKDQPSKNVKGKTNPQVSAIKTELEDQELNLSVDLEIAVSDTLKTNDSHLGKSNQGIEGDGLSVIERYRRLTKKNVRSPRRDTYVINNKTKTSSNGKASSKMPTRQSKLRSGLIKPSEATGRKTQPPESAKPPSTKQTVSKTISAVPTRLSSSGSQDGSQDVFNSSSSSSSSNCSVSSLPCLKRPSSQGKKMSRLKQPQVTKGIAKLKKSSLDTITLKPDANGGGDQPRKIPTSKPSLLKPSGMKTRSTGIARLKPSGTTHNKVTPTVKRKSQPMKATLTFEKTSKDTSVPHDNGLRSSLRRPSTPGTPRGQDKPLLPRKRILSSASSCSTRTVSRTSSSDLDSSVPSSTSFTPMGKSRRRSCLPTPSSMGTSARRRSGLPTPNKMSKTDDHGSSVPVTRPSSKSSELSPALKNPAILRVSETNVLDLNSPATLSSSPDLKPRKISKMDIDKEKNPAILRVSETNILDLNSPAMLSSSPDLKPRKISKMDIDKEGSTSSPAIGMLINLNDLPTKSVPNSLTKQLFHQAEEVKENLIDF